MFSINRAESEQCTYLKGPRSAISSTESVLPYHGHMTNIWIEKAMKETRQTTRKTNMRPSSLPIGWRGGGGIQRIGDAHSRVLLSGSAYHATCVVGACSFSKFPVIHSSCNELRYRPLPGGEWPMVSRERSARLRYAPNRTRKRVPTLVTTRFLPGVCRWRAV